MSIDIYQHILAFREAMEKHGLIFKGELVPDAGIQRVHAEGDSPGSRNIWYKFNSDARPAGAFGCWKKFQDQKFTWVADRGANPMTPEERAQLRAKIDADKLRRAAEQQAKHDDAAARAQAIWDAAGLAPDTHPYLRKKKINAHGIRVADWSVDGDPDPETGEIPVAIVKNALIVPLVDRKDHVVSLQGIFPSEKNKLHRGKDYFRDGKKKGCYFTIGGRPTEIDGALTFLFGEGFSTCATLHEATGIFTVVCFDASNILPVVLLFRENFPAARFVICADNDAWTEKPIANPGVHHARKAAEAVSGILAIPEFKSVTLKPTDFNDLAAEEGAAAVLAKITAAINPAPGQAGAEAEPVAKPKKDLSLIFDGPMTPEQIARHEASMLETKLAPNFRIDKHGVHKTDAKEDAVLVCSHLTVDALTRNENGEEWGRMLTVTDPDGNKKSYALPMSMLAGEGAVYREILLGIGLIIAPGKSANANLQEYISQCVPKVRRRCVGRLGWHGLTFVLPDGAIGIPGGEEVVYQSASKARPAFGSRGTLAEWQEHVATPARGNSRLVIAIAFALTGPVLNIVGGETGGIHLRGGSSTGKSTALELAGSVWGGGPNGFTHTWRTTDNAMEGLAAAHSDTLLCLDELSQATAQTASDVSYMVANGSGKSRAGRNGELKAAATWRTNLFSTGEISLTDKIAELGRGRHAAAGQEVRIIDLPADAKAGYGVFEHLGDFETGPACNGKSNQAKGAMFSTHLKEQAKRYYGTAGRAFVQHLVEHPFDAVQAIADKRRAWIADNVPAGADGQVQRVADRFALIGAAGEYAAENGILPWPENESETAATACFREWLGSRGGVGSAETTTIVGRVRAFIESHGQSRFQIIGNEALIALHRAGWRKLAADDRWDYLITTTAWREEICQGIDPKRAAEELIRLGFIKPGTNGKPYRQQWINKMGNVSVYHVKADFVGTAGVSSPHGNDLANPDTDVA